MHSPSRLVRSFLKSGPGGRYSDEEGEWLRAVFAVILKVARKNRRFTMDDIWDGIDRARSAGRVPRSGPDHRVLGPMLLHMANEGVVRSTGYYSKSTRRGGGNRPVTIWESMLEQRQAAA